MTKKLFVLILIINCNVSFTQIQEMRGTWLTNIDSNVLFSDKLIAEAMNYLSSIGINTVYVCVWNKGYTLYPSKVMNDHFGIPIWQSFSGRDPLEKVIIEAHKNGIEVIAWFEYGLSSWYAQNQNDSGHIIKKYPHWALLDRNGKFATREGVFPQFIWLSGINPEVQNFIISLFTEVIDKYDIDGVQADDRLPAMPVEGGYDSISVAIYKLENNGQLPPYDFQNSQWKRWRANKLNQFFKRLYDSVKVRGDYLIFSSTPSVYPWGYENYLQDSKTWVDSGYCDTFMPQLYRYDFDNYLYELNLALSYVPLSKRKIFFPAVLMKIGNWLIDENYLLNVLNANRQKGLKGESFFFYEGLRANNNKLGDTLKSTFYSNEAFLPYRSGNIWRPKGILVDDTSLATIKTGRWTYFPSNGYVGGFSITNDTSYCSIEYYADIQYDAFYHLYIYLIPNYVNYNQARYTIYHQNDSTIVYVDQSKSSNAGWNKLGDFYFTKGYHKVLKLDNSGLPASRYLVSDAILLLLNRKLSSDLIITKVEENDDRINQIKISEVVKIYPNPFNSYTSIEIDIEDFPEIEVEIYDLLGRKIFKKVFEKIDDGRVVFKFNADDFRLSSGIYLGFVKMGAKYQTFKLNYIK
ncbi:MAG: family 10 glycosylhydrolase [Ignavibacteria bacterium]